MLLLRFFIHLINIAHCEIMKTQYILAKTKDNILRIINSDELIIHRDKQELQVGDEVSQSGKSRNERGRGKVIALGKSDK